MPTRHAFVAGFLVLVSLFAARPAMAADTPARPNIVILYADDMGYGDLGAQNPKSKIPTPFLNKLASEGCRFTDAHSSSGICSPSRYALLTGQYHWRKFHEIVQSFGPSVFAAEQLTLPEMLKQKGYATACIGKWHLGWNWDAIRKSPGVAPDAFDWSKPIPDGPLAHGFDYYFGDDVPNFPPYTWIENDRVLMEPTVPVTATPPAAEGKWEARPGPMAPSWRLDAVMPRLTEKAVSYVAGRKGKPEPFFLYVPFTSPHAPIVPTQEFVGKSQAGGYGDFMTQTDWTCGQILNALDDHGFRDNTIVIFSADNGPENYAIARETAHNHFSRGELRGYKRYIYEGGHRVPMVVRWPGVIQPGRVEAALTGQIDLMATLAAVVGAELPAGQAIDSLNMLPLWKGEALEAPLRTSMVHNTFARHYAVRKGDWVLVNVDSPAAAGKGQPPRNNRFAKDPADDLYNLKQDIGQTKRLTEAEPQKVKELKAEFERIRARGQRPEHQVRGRCAGVSTSDR